MYVCYDFIAGNSDENESGGCGQALIYLSWILIGLTMPFSLFVCFKVKSIEVPPRGLQMIEKKNEYRCQNRGHSFMFHFIYN